MKQRNDLIQGLLQFSESNGVTREVIKQMLEDEFRRQYAAGKEAGFHQGIYYVTSGLEKTKNTLMDFIEAIEESIEKGKEYGTDEDS